MHLAIWPALTLILCLALLQPVKGAVVGLQYALGMHGFGRGPDARKVSTRTTHVTDAETLAKMDRLVSAETQPQGP